MANKNWKLQPVITEKSYLELIDMKYTVALEPSESGGFIVQCLELPAAISQGETKEEAIMNIKEAIELVLEAKKKQASILGEIVEVNVAHT